MNPEDEIKLFDAAVRMLRDPAKAHTWLRSPSPALRGKSPIEYATTPERVREVEDLIGRLRHGIL